MNDKNEQIADKPPAIAELTKGTARPSQSVALTARLAHEIPKPKDWAAFQRNCVILFRAELRDPHTHEYGRQGQNQHGIDILGRRDSDPERYVGIQCRKEKKSLTEAKILSDCRAALKLEASLKEIIFVTTNDDDTKMSDAAVAVEKTLRGEGHDVLVVVFAWGHLQTLIALHEDAYNAFFPSNAASATPRPLQSDALDLESLALLAATLAEKMKASAVAVVATDTPTASQSDEDPVLHARIDAYRDLFKKDDQPRLAERKLLEITPEELEGKPWARYRVETNLGSVAIDLGREADGAARFEKAHAIRPHDPNAIANLSLARTIQGRPDEAVELAQAALAGEPRAEHATAYLLQALARTAWQGDPTTVIPDDLRDTASTAVGLTEFYHRRDEPGWAEKVLEIAERHPDSEELKRTRSLAILVLASADGDFLAGRRVPVTRQQISQAADDMKAIAEHVLNVDFEHEHDVEAHVNNAAVLLRFAKRGAEAIPLIERALTKLAHNEALLKLLAVLQVATGNRGGAIKTLERATTPEGALFRIDLMSADDTKQALEDTLALDPGQDAGPRGMRWRLIGIFARRLSDVGRMRNAVAGLRDIDADDLMASLLEIAADHRDGLTAAEARKRLQALGESLPADAEMSSRYMVADELSTFRAYEAAADLLKDHVDLSRLNPAAELYIQALAAARRDIALEAALDAADASVRDDPEMQWVVAAHAWNIGDISKSLLWVNRLLSRYPDNGPARLLKVEALIRQDKSAEVFAELDNPLENLDWPRLNDRFRVARLLGAFGYLDRASALAYRLFLQHRDHQPAWMTLSALVLSEGRGDEASKLFSTPVVADDVAVDLVFADGSNLFFVVEPSAELRGLDPESWEPPHPLVQAVMGKAQGEAFTAPDGREGVVKQLRHKFVARFHYVLDHYEERFPTIFGFERIRVDVDAPDGLDELIEMARERREWVQQQQEEYEKGDLPIAVLARRIGTDVIDVAQGLVANGSYIDVESGGIAERNQASQFIRDNSHRGCVLDLLTFWHAWRLGALEAIQSTCGPINLPQSVIDGLRERRARLADGAIHGIKTGGYADGKLVMDEASPALVAGWRDNVDAAIAWAGEHATIRPIVASETILPAFREQLRRGDGSLIDPIVLAQQLDLLLVTDDRLTRIWNSAAGSQRGTWLLQVFVVAVEQEVLDYSDFTRWSAHLVGAGQRSLGVSALMLANALLLDVRDNDERRSLFVSMARAMGDRDGNMESHVGVCASCIKLIWNEEELRPVAEWATGHLIRQLLRHRHEDFRRIFVSLYRELSNWSAVLFYMQKWAVGHFMPEVFR